MGYRCAFLSHELVCPRSGLLFLALVIHSWLSPWVPWFSPFQFVVTNLGEVPHYQFCWASHSGCQETGIKYNSLGAVSTAVVFEEVYLSQSQLQGRGDAEKGEHSATYFLEHICSATRVCARACARMHMHAHAFGHLKGSGPILSWKSLYAILLPFYLSDRRKLRP